MRDIRLIDWLHGLFSTVRDESFYVRATVAGKVVEKTDAREWTPSEICYEVERMAVAWPKARFDAVLKGETARVQPAGIFDPTPRDELDSVAPQAQAQTQSDRDVLPVYQVDMRFVNALTMALSDSTRVMRDMLVTSMKQNSLAMDTICRAAYDAGRRHGEDMVDQEATLAALESDALLRKADATDRAVALAEKTLPMLGAVAAQALAARATTPDSDD